MKKSVLILNYHQVVKDNNLSQKQNRFCISIAKLLEQIEAIKEEQIPIISLSECLDREYKTPFSIVLTFDDGNKSDYTRVFDLLKQQNVTASFFPILSQINSIEGVSWEQLIEMKKSGFTIGSHGVNHKNLTQISEKECYFELSESKRVLEQYIDNEVEFIAIPYGMYNKRTELLLKKAGYKKALTTRAKVNKNKESFFLHRVNIKASISIKEFKKIISLNKYQIQKKRMISNISFIANKKIGTDRINSILNN